MLNGSLSMEISKWAADIDDSWAVSASFPVPQVHIYLWAWRCLTRCPPFHLPQSFSASSQPALGSHDVCPLLIWLFVQGCGRGSSARRALTTGPSWGRNTQKWRWCTEQVKPQKKTRNNNHPGCWRLYFHPANNCTGKQFQFQNALNICKVQSARFHFITRHLMIN